MSEKDENVLVLACMKDEGPFLLQWLSSYKSNGVAKFIIVSDDCSGGIDHLLDRLDEMGLIRHLPNPIMIESFEKSIQNIALK